MAPCGLSDFSKSDIGGQIVPNIHRCVALELWPCCPPVAPLFSRGPSVPCYLNVALVGSELRYSSAPRRGPNVHAASEPVRRVGT